MRLVPFAFINLVIMLLFRYLGASLLGTAAVVLTFTVQIRASETADKACEQKIHDCLKGFEYERLDAGNDSCTRFIEKVLLCADFACTTKEQKTFAVQEMEHRLCSQCRTFGICTYNELLAEMQAEEAELDKMKSHVITPKSNIGKSSSIGATLSSSAVIVLLSALKTAWSVCM